MKARPRLPLVVEIKVGVVGTDPSGAVPVDTPIPEENILPATAVIRAIAIPDLEVIVVARLIGENGHPRRMLELERARMPRRMAVTDVIGVVPAKHALIPGWIG